MSTEQPPGPRAPTWIWWRSPESASQKLDVVQTVSGDVYFIDNALSVGGPVLGALACSTYMQ